MGNGLAVSGIITYLFGSLILIAAAFLVFRVLKIPVAAVAKAVISTVLGGCAIYLTNYGLSYFGLSIGLNPVTAVFTGMFGLPGLVSLVVLRLVV